MTAPSTDPLPPEEIVNPGGSVQASSYAEEMLMR